MAYQTYITEALVCGSLNSNTADRTLFLFTREAGMIFAQVKSMREERSKHRYALQDFSHARVTLVRGKSGWRITGAEAIQNLYSKTTTRDARAFLRNTFLLLRRVIHGETPHSAIFDDILSAENLCESIDPKRLEIILAHRILYTLGYIALEGEKQEYAGQALTKEYIDTITDAELLEYRLLIEHALHESQL